VGNRLSSTAASLIRGIVAFFFLNFIYLTLVVGMDVLFHVAPQVVIPLFVPGLCAVVGVITAVVRSARSRASSPADANFKRATNRIGEATGRRRAPVLQSALIIRRRNARNTFNDGRRRAYASIS
jgi:hypothetical protein